jgi:predicted XRE-type DNA-binding protein
MSFPDKKRLDKMRSRLEKAEGTVMLSPDATPLEKLRWDICQGILKFKNDHNMTQDELAKAMGIDKSKVSKILHHRIKEFSTDRLIKLLQGLKPRIKIKVS